MGIIVLALSVKPQFSTVVLMVNLQLALWRGDGFNGLGIVDQFPNLSKQAPINSFMLGNHRGTMSVK